MLFLSTFLFLFGHVDAQDPPIARCRHDKLISSHLDSPKPQRLHNQANVARTATNPLSVGPVRIVMRAPPAGNRTKPHDCNNSCR